MPDDELGHDDASVTLSKDRERALEEFGRHAGAALRSPAPSQGAATIARRVRNQRIIRVGGATAGVIVLLVIGAVAIGRGDDPNVQHPVDTVTDLTVPVTTVASDPTTALPSTTVEPTSTTAARPAATGALVATPGVSVDDDVGAMTYSSDGSVLYATAPGGDATAPGVALRVYDPVTLTVQHELACPTSPVGDDGIGVDGLAWDQEVAATWDTEARAAVSTFNFSPYGIPCPVMFSPDGTRAAQTFTDRATLQPRTTLWDATTGTEIATLETTGLSFSPDGTRLLGDQYVGIQPVHMGVWDTQTGELLGRFEPHRQGNVSPLERPAFSPDGTHIATNSGVGLELWDARTFVKLKEIDTDRGVYRLAFNSDGSRIATTNRSYVSIWDVSSGEELMRLSEPDKKIRDEPVLEQLLHVTYSPDQTLIITGGDMTGVGLYDATTGQELTLLSFDPAAIEQQMALNGDTVLPNERGLCRREPRRRVPDDHDHQGEVYRNDRGGTTKATTAMDLYTRLTGRVALAAAQARPPRTLFEPEHDTRRSGNLPARH